MDFNEARDDWVAVASAGPYAKLECGPMPNVIAALTNIAPSVQRRSVADAHY